MVPWEKVPIMDTKPIRKSHPDDSRRQAVAMVVGESAPLAEVARRLGVNPEVFRKWKLKYAPPAPAVEDLYSRAIVGEPVSDTPDTAPGPAGVGRRGDPPAARIGSCTRTGDADTRVPSTAGRWPTAGSWLATAERGIDR